MMKHLALAPLALAVISAFSPVQADDMALGEVTVNEKKHINEQMLSPATTAGLDRTQLAETVNVVNSEDSFKYLPNILVRKRFIGDTDAPISSRTTGINASARSLVYADGTLLTPLINNNNGNGSPRWFMVSPEEIERVDVMYGPFSAAYAGNSYGLVANIATRMPERLEGSVKVLGAWQDFKYYGTHDTYESKQLAASVGNRIGNFSFWLSANHLDSYSMPVSFAVNPTPSGGAGTAVSGGYFDANKYGDRDRSGVATQILGAGNLTHTVQDNAKLKLAYDFSPTIRAAYTFGIWQNTADTSAQTYLTNPATGAAYWGGTAGQVTLGGRNYKASDIAALFVPGHKEMEHQMHSFSLRDKGDGVFGWNMAFSNYEYVTHQERTGNVGTNAIYPTVSNGSGAGKTVDMKGTGWTTADLSGTWSPQGAQGPHTISAGVHYDLYKLVSPTYNTTGNWLNAPNGSLNADSRGKTETQALWLQDVWRFAPAWQATLGARQEWWRAFEGSNFASNTRIAQPERSDSAISPKASLSWFATNDLMITGSFGKAVRFPTVGELYLTQTVNGVPQTSNPNLKPEHILSSELAFDYTLDDGKLRLSLFEERVSDALISQTGTYPGIAGITSFMQNVDKTRQRGIELVAQKNDVLVRGLELTGSLTYVDAKILANSSYVAPAWNPGATSAGKRTPYVPEWRATLVATYRPNDQLSYTLAGRYSGRMYSTIDGTDTHSNTYMGFASFFVADARIRYDIDKHWIASVGVDNLNNRKYFLFHPFPQRTAFAELKYAF